MNNKIAKFDDIFDSFGNFGWLPSLLKQEEKSNIIENSDSYKIEVNAAGVPKDKIKVLVEDNILTISFENKKEVKDEKYLRQSFSYTKYNESFTIPEDCDVSQIDGEMKDGLLLITIKKKNQPSESKPKLIEIK
jgi:HSP20 family protein